MKTDEHKHLCKMQEKNYEVNRKFYKVAEIYKHQPKLRAKSNSCLKHGTTIVLKLQTKEIEK